MEVLEVIKVDNGSKFYPGNFAKKEQEIIRKNATGNILNLFSGISHIGHYRVDYNCKEANIHLNVFHFLESYNSNIYNNIYTVIIDAPYNQKFGDKYQKFGNTPKQFIIFANTKGTNKLFDLIEQNIKPKILIIKSWNYYIPINYYLEKGYLCYAGGFRKPTILEILKRYPNNFKER